jgi:geranylgeranyl diphosphate synthase type I
VTIALPTTLLRARELVDPALRAAVQRLDSASRDLASYHFGCVDADRAPLLASGGKAVRPALAMLSGQAAGAVPAIAVPGAVAVELVHNFSLLHDDLMDGDVERRHRPTVWALHGAAAAILAGDAMLALATQVLLDLATIDAIEAARMLAGATQELIRGQHADLAFERRADVTVDRCLDMAAGKTGALLACSAAIGAVLAGAERDVVAALWAYGMELGIAFQLVDDLLGIWGDPASTGKPVGSDLRARKNSLPITYATTHGGEAGRRLAEWLRSPGPDSDDDIHRAAELVDLGGGRTWAAEEARRRLAMGERALGRAAVAPDAGEELVALGRFIVTRES